MSSAPEELDNPLYGDFEDYLDGKLPPARHREVAELLAHSAAAREVLEELRTARQWLEGTRWDIPEPTTWPSADEILARAGRRMVSPPAVAATKSIPAAGGTGRWSTGWMSWRWNVRSPAWPLGAAASVVLLVGGGLWWVLSPSAPDELAQSKVAETSAPPPSESPAQPGAATGRPDDPARPVLPGEAAPAGGAASRKKDPAASALEAAESGDEPKRSKPSAGPTAVTEDSQRVGIASVPSPLVAPAGQPSGQAPAVPAPSAGEGGTHKAEAMSAEQREARPSVAAPPLEAGAAPPATGRSSGAGTADRARDAMKEAPKAKPGAAPNAQGTAAPVTALTLRLVVANRRAALTQVATVVRELGGTVERNGEQLMVTVPAGHVADCAARLRARVSVATEGETLQVTIRERE